MKNKELISVILPVWKPNIKQLKKCLHSLINQTYSNLEIIISYRTEKNFDKDFYSLINSISDPRIKIIKNKKIGLANSLNDGIFHSKGDLIARIDADDYSEFNRFEKQLEFKKLHNYDIIGTWAKIISDSGKILGKIELPVTHSEIRKKIMLHNPILHSSILMDKKIFGEIGYYDTSFIHTEDYELWFRALKNNYQFGNIPEYLIYSRETTGSITRGSEWRKQRRFNIKVKSKAFFEYGFTNPYDIIYFLISPITFFISPTYALKSKRMIGWYK